MPVFKGVASYDTPVYSDAFNIPATIKSFYLYNAWEDNDFRVTVSIVNDSLTEETIIFSKIILRQESYSTNIPVLILPGYLIKITTPKVFDFYFTIE
jgi:hypothetical protein